MTLSPRLRPALVSLLAGVLATAGGVAATGGSASAEPRPTLRQVQRQVDAHNHQAEQATERYNTARVELNETNRRLRAVRHRFDRQRRTFSQMQAVMGR